VTADLIDLAVGRAGPTFHAAKYWNGANRGFEVERSERVRSRFYLRLTVKDRPGTLAEVCRILAEQGISLASVIQHEAPEGMPEATIPLVIVTHYAATGKFRAAVEAIAKLPSVAAKPVAFSVDD
jgi:homoserine dehydrogenase